MRNGFGAGVGEHEVDGVLHVFAFLVPLVDGGQQKLIVHLPAHDKEAAA